MRKINTKRLIIWGLAIVPLLIIGIFNNSLPDQIPIHWSLDGSVQYGSHFTLWINGSMGILSESLNPGRINVEMVIVLLVGVLFAIIGNMMPKFKNNFFIGIRTPWTLANAEVWNRTHRLAGIMWVFGGLVIIAAAIMLSSSALFTVVMGVTLTISIVPALMSYFWFREIKK